MLIQLASLTPQFCKWTFFTWNISVIFRTFQKKTGNNTVNPKLVGGLEHGFYFSIFFHILGMSSAQLTFTPSFFRGVGQPPSSKAFLMTPLPRPRQLPWDHVPPQLSPADAAELILTHIEKGAFATDVSKPLVSCERWWFPRGKNRQARCLPGTWSPRPIRRTWGGRIISWSEQVFSPAVVAYEIASSLITNVGKTMSQTIHDWECMIVLADAASKDSSPFANVCNVVLLHVIFAMFFSHARSYVLGGSGLIMLCRLFSGQLL